MDPSYPLVKVITSDKHTLAGLMHPANSQRAIIHIHGTSGSFFHNDFYPYLARIAQENNFAFLQTNNRGAGNYEYELGEPPHGAALEIFEDSLFDLSAWIEYCHCLGYSEIILSSHSFGTEKVVYYLNQGQYKDSVIGVILLGFCDSVGNQQRYENKIGKNYFFEANKLVKEGKELTLLSDIFGGIAGEAPLSARSYLNFYSPGSVLSQVMPFHLGNKLEMYSHIKVPILAIIGDNDLGEYTILPIKKAISLLKQENPLTTAYQIPDCDHGFHGKESELSALIDQFLKKHFRL